MDSSEKLQILRHSAAHLLAQAILELYPKTILTIGPATKDGFFYDVLPERNFKEEDLPILEARMHELSKKNYPITHKEISKEKAREIFKNNPFKLELIDGIPGETVGLSQQGDFYDLCRGGHVASTSDIKYFKLLTISGSYWRADRNNQALQRITGTAFLTQQDLDEYERLKQEAEKYDHRKLGKQMDLFSFHDEGVGFPFFHPKGKLVINLLTNFLKKILEKHAYKEIATPVMLSEDLWKQSGHYAHYKDNMYFSTIDDKTYAIRPMNCPGAILTYKERPGLFRVRAFTQDDAHVFCTVDQLHHEVASMVAMIFDVYKKFDFTGIKIAISTKPAHAMGSNELWEKATAALKYALDEAGVAYSIKEGEGAFYGPKIEFIIQDSMKREWQCGTIQVDFAQPENFDLSYISPQGTKERPVMIHRAIYGSMERFFGILLEHYKGHLPFWLSPVQIRILTITDAQKEYANALLLKLKEYGVRAELDHSSDPISGQIKSAQLEKVPWMLVLGKKEMDSNTITLRHFDGKQEMGLTFEELLAKIKANS